ELIARIRAGRPEMAVLVATAYMNEAEDFDNLVVINDGVVLAVGSPAKIKRQQGATTLEEAYVALLPEARRRGHRRLEIPPPPRHDGAPAIAAENLTRRFGDFTAVHRVRAQSQRGATCGLLRSSGCGQ